MYDILVKGGRVIDPAQKINGIMDVAVSGDKIALVAANIPSGEAKKIVDAKDKIVTPGLIDMHAHVYEGVVDIGANPDDVGVNQGVTTVLDCGTAGYANFGGFPKYVVPSAKTTVYCLLHINSLGLSVRPEIRSFDDINIAATEATIAAYPDLIRGVKLRLVGKLVANQGIEVVKIAKATAKKFKLPLMVHIGDSDKQVPQALTKEILPLLERGDILSHIYTGQQGEVLGQDGKVIPEYAAAEKRGVLMDAAHGRLNLVYPTARKMIAQGYFPTIISTDLTKPSIKGPVYGLTVIMSKFLKLGLSIEQLIPMVTINPAKTIHINAQKGSLKPGMDADISVIGIKTGKWRLIDTNNEPMDVDRLITPVITVKVGKLIKPTQVGRPEEIK